MSDRTILAFVHIEKAAGTTFNSILQRNFLARHCDVVPMHKNDNRIFSSKSLKTLIKINPFLKSISGHSVSPYSNFTDTNINIKYLTFFREPISRYISQYQYSVVHRGSRWTFQDFLDKEYASNFQTKKIAGTADFLQAKSILENIFFFVGITEKFNESLLLLKEMLKPLDFDVRFESKNVSKNTKIQNSIAQGFDKYRKQIETRNIVDIQLYDYVINTLYPKQLSRHQEVITHADTYNFNLEPSFSAKAIFFIYKVFRKLYYEQIVKLIRFLNKSNNHRYY